MNQSPNSQPERSVSSETFEAEVLRAARPVLVMFWAPWSHPCQILAATVDQLAVACAGKAKVVKVNADDNPDLSVWYEIQSIPTLLYFIQGTVRARIVGTASPEAILAKLEAVCQGANAAPSRPQSTPDHPSGNR